MVKSIDMTRKITPVQDLIALYKLCIYILNEKPDIVYTFTPKAGLLGMIASFLSRVPVRIHNVVGMPLMEARGKKFFLLNMTLLCMVFHVFLITILVKKYKSEKIPKEFSR